MDERIYKTFIISSDTVLYFENFHPIVKRTLRKIERQITKNNHLLKILNNYFVYSELILSTDTDHVFINYKLDVNFMLNDKEEVMSILTKLYPEIKEIPKAKFKLIAGGYGIKNIHSIDDNYYIHVNSSDEWEILQKQ